MFLQLRTTVNTLKVQKKKKIREAQVGRYPLSAAVLNSGVFKNYF